MHLLSFLGVIVLVAGNTEGSHRAGRHNAYGRQARSLKHMYRSKYHQRMHSIPPAFVGPPGPSGVSSSSSAPSGGFLSFSTLSRTGGAMATVTPSEPSVVFVNTTDKAMGGHRGGGSFWHHNVGPWPSSSCSAVVTTLTETVNITVSVTATPYAVTTHLNSTTTWGNDTVSCTSTSTEPLPTTTSDPCPDSTTLELTPSPSLTATAFQFRTRTRSRTRTRTSRPPTRSPSSINTSPTPIRTITRPPQTIRITLSSVLTTPFPSPSSISTPSPPPIPTDCVIDPFLAPNKTASLPPSTPTHARQPAIHPTSTVCAYSAPSGAPNPANLHCGVRGSKTTGGRDGGEYFLGRYLKNGKDVDVTLQGCWQFCDKSVWGTSHGCQAYEFHAGDEESGGDGPRCDLYGGAVAYALEEVDARRAETWFDLACGDPTEIDWKAMAHDAHDVMDSGSRSE